MAAEDIIPAILNFIVSLSKWIKYSKYLFQLNNHQKLLEPAKRCFVSPINKLSMPKRNWSCYYITQPQFLLNCNIMMKQKRKKNYCYYTEASLLKNAFFLLNKSIVLFNQLEAWKVLNQRGSRLTWSFIEILNKYGLLE